MVKDNKLIGEKIFKARENAGHTQKVMAALIAKALKQGYSSRQYQKLEAGIFPKFKSDIITTVDKILKTSFYSEIYEQNVPHGTKKGDFDHENAHQELISYLEDLKTGQQNIWNQGQVVRQEVAGVADYMMLKDAEWDQEKMKALKETYYRIVRGGPAAVSLENKLKADRKSGRG